MARRALLMGNADYPADDVLPDLLCPINDVDGLSAVLEDPALGGFETVRTLRDATSIEAKRALVTFLREAQPRDTVLFYFSGHGKLDGSFALHLCTRESEAEMLEATALPISFVQDQLGKCRAESSVLLLDCCFSGMAKGAKGAVGDMLKVALEGTGTYLLTASGSIETAREKEGDRYGVFTKHVIEGLQSGAADHEGRGFITMDDLYDYVIRAVRADSPQQPNRQFTGHGDIVIARSGRDSRKDRADAARRTLYGHVAKGMLDPRLAQAAVDALEKPVSAQSPLEAAIEAAALHFLDRKSTLGQFVSAYWTAREPPETRPPKSQATIEGPMAEPQRPAENRPKVEVVQDKLPDQTAKEPSPKPDRPKDTNPQADDGAPGQMHDLAANAPNARQAGENRQKINNPLDWAQRAPGLESQPPGKPSEVRKPRIGRALATAMAAAVVGLVVLLSRAPEDQGSLAPEVMGSTVLTELESLGFEGSGDGLSGGVNVDDAALVRLSELQSQLPHFGFLDLGSATGITNLEPLKGMPLTSLNLGSAAGITSLDPLQGMPLTWLNLYSATGITSLEPLKGMPLISLNLGGAAGITSLDPLQGMPLTWLSLYNATGITSLEPLRGMPLTYLNLYSATGITNLEPLQGMPLTWLSIGGGDGIDSLWPLQGMRLTELYLGNATGLTSIVPLRGMQLTSLELTGATGITNLEPLQGMPLTYLKLSDAAGIASLDPLQGMPLTWLYLYNATGLTDLKPLRGMPLTDLYLGGASGISNVDAMHGMQLTSLNLTDTGVTDLSPLQGMPLTWLYVGATGIANLDALRGMLLTTLNLSGSDGITSLDPLGGMPLTWLDLSYVTGITSIEILRGMPLTHLDLTGATEITSIAPLKGMDVEIVGASPDLLATLE